MGNLDAQALSAWCDAVMEVRISSYERTPSPRLRAVLTANGFLAPLPPGVSPIETWAIANGKQVGLV